ncbi:homogentisate 1,2-dioxygenase-domain-containing protein, partial [Lipomyces tetrasporus]
MVSMRRSCPALHLQLHEMRTSRRMTNIFNDWKPELKWHRWFYRILPGASHPDFKLEDRGNFNFKSRATNLHVIPNQIRWNPFDLDEGATFINGLRMVAGAGDIVTKTGLGIYIYAAGKSMENEAIYSADGDFLIVPQHGDMDIQTEMGYLYVRPEEVVVIPRGVRFCIKCPTGPIRGYILELHTGHFNLPELGPIGSNCLANGRDFEAPVAAYEDVEEDYTVYCKFDGQLFRQFKAIHRLTLWRGMEQTIRTSMISANSIPLVKFLSITLIRRSTPVWRSIPSIPLNPSVEWKWTVRGNFAMEWIHE